MSTIDACLLDDNGFMHAKADHVFLHVCAKLYILSSLGKADEIEI